MEETAKSRSLVGADQEALGAIFAEIGEKPFRARQVYDAIYRRRVLDLGAMTELSKALRDKLAADFEVTATRVARVFESSDGTRRYLLELGDGEQVEAVFIPEPARDTICISSQVGCAVGCTFCMTARLNIRRNMTAGEIVSQVLVVLADVYGANADLPHGTNVVYMGMGEPFLNYRNVIESVALLCDEKGIGINPKRITISTSGVVGRIRDFANEPIRPHLAISLSATTDAQRDELIPLNRKHDIAALLAACREFPVAFRERLTFEYVMLDGVNDSDEDARRLARLLDGMAAKVNLIPHNPAPELPYRASPRERVLAFQSVLVERGVHAFIRRPRGQDVSAACGQLAARPEAAASTSSAG